MKRSFFAFLVFILIYCLQLTTLQRCATPTAPSGGARDTIGPVLIADESTPNFQTNFRPEEIVLTFDEWVELDPQQQIVISPPLDLGEDNRPALRRRSLVIPLAGLELLDSVTYVVNIGAAIKDLNEGNPTENLRFVFATGPVLDSASVTGTLVEAFSGKPVESATFTLYANLSDTAATTVNPTYFAQTDEEGKFTVYNIRPGRYRAVALLRNPSATNYFLDFAGYAQPQSVGFIDTILTINDGVNPVGTVRLSPVAKPVRVNAIDTTTYGLIGLTINQPAENTSARYTGDYLRRNHNDTLKLYYQTAGPDTIFIGLDTTAADTVVFTPPAEDITGTLVLEQGPGRRINPAEGINLRFSRPITNLDTILVSLTTTQDSVTTAVPYRYQLDSLYPGNLRLEADWQDNTNYGLQLLPGAVTAWNGVSNPDSIVVSLAADSPEKYGILNLTLANLDSTTNYILRLLNKEEPVPGTERYVDQRTTYSVTYAGLKPAPYRAEIIYDNNGNGRYDPGDFLRSRQPETIRRFELEALRANWEVEENIDLASE
ncbi:MAG: hypothetical protein AAFZ52_09675 [Bacteroidota bacterium]